MRNIPTTVITSAVFGSESDLKTISRSANVSKHNTRSLFTLFASFKSMSSTGTMGAHAYGLQATSPRLRDSGLLIWLAALLTLALAGGVYYAGPLVAPALRSADDLAISASDSQGRMRVTWNRNSPLIESADSARLDVVD